jgi:hypothetical protein
MSLTERLFDGILKTIKLNDKVDSLGRQIAEIVKDQRDHEQRLVRLDHPRPPDARAAPGRNSATSGRPRGTREQAQAPLIFSAPIPALRLSAARPSFSC